MKERKYYNDDLIFACIVASLIITVAATLATYDNKYFALSQPMLVFNTTGNRTDAKGSSGGENLTSISIPPGTRYLIPNNNSSSNSSASQAPPSNTTSRIVVGNDETYLEYPALRKVIIVSGAALKGDQAFSPNPAKINTGGTVMWINADLVTHTITSGTGFSDPEMGKYFDSGLMGGSYEKKLDKPGVYPYFCQVHPQMAGKVIVKATTGKEDLYSSTKPIPPFNGTSPATIYNNNTETANSSALISQRPSSAITDDNNNSNEGRNSKTIADDIAALFNKIFGGH